MHRNQTELREKKVFKSLLLIACEGLAIVIKNPANYIDNYVAFKKGNSQVYIC